MKAGHVAQMVGAVADQMEAKHKAENVTNDIHGLKLRVEALENLVDVISDALLAGTSADPESPKSAAATKSGTVAKTSKRARK